MKIKMSSGHIKYVKEIVWEEVYLNIDQRKIEVLTLKYQVINILRKL